jgi:hypothetical protein
MPFMETAMSTLPNNPQRRSILKRAAALAALPLTGALATSTANASTAAAAPRMGGRRMLGKLQVSSIGLGVQNMSRTYQTPSPRAPRCTASSVPRSIAG